MGRHKKRNARQSGRYMRSANSELVFGFPAEWRDFRKRHALFLEKFPHLEDALKAAFIRSSEIAEPIDKFVFLYGRLCAEDFSEVLLCCGNGYGAAAMKLVRTLYERAVTLRYLHDNPDKLDDFLDFSHIAKYKQWVAIKETFGKDALSEEMAEDVEQRYLAMKDKFMVTDCEKCDTKKLNHTWSKLDFVAMAKRAGGLAAIIVPGYYMPLRHAHSTLAALFSRLEPTTTGGISFSPDAQRDIADDALITAYNTIIAVLRVQEERFNIPGLQEKIDVCETDFLEIYRKKEN
jgi:hypothetical protein